MKKLYATVDINKPNLISKIKYYETKKENYGIEIVREVNNKVLERKAIDNIANTKRNISKVLELLTNELVTPKNVEYIEEDLIF